MEPIELEPTYSPNDTSGKCIKCLARDKLNTCLKELLRDDVDNPVYRQNYEALMAFLISPESEKLRIESDRYLAEGKRVIVRIGCIDGKLKYELEVKQ